MFSRRLKLTATASVAALGLSGYFLYSAFSTQGAGELAQSPMNVAVAVPPSFIMAVDDSGSMTFQTLFPGQDGEGCWNTSRKSFFDASGSLNTSGNCDYLYVLPGTRINNYYGVPPIDSLGFARSAAYNPTYYDPTVKYEPWDSGGNTPTYGNASTTATLIDPRGTDTVALAANRYSTASYDQFRLQSGMVLPKGTKYRATNSNNDVTVNNDTTWNGGATNVYMQYWPATFFMPWTASTDAYPSLDGDATVYASMTRVKVSDACGSGCAMWKYTITSSNAAALQNFANWYSYYGNRNRAIIAGMTRSLSSVNNMYVGYFRINQYGNYDSPLTSSNERVTMYDMSNTTQKKTLYSTLVTLPASGGTPNRYAVE